jgi:TRAP-type C4-dicarboxylate transport system permease small subunit
MKTILTFFLLNFFVSHFSFGQTNSASLKVDTTITGFHLATISQGTYYYTPNGASDLKAENISSFAYSILPNVSMKIAVGEIENLYNISRQNGYQLNDVVKKDTSVNGNKAYIISYTETDKAKGYQNMVFYAVLMIENTSIIFFVN